jgi:hypothetical protein
MELEPTGEFKEALTTAYMVTLITTSTFLGYIITFTGLNWGDVLGDDYSDFTDQVIITDGEDNIINATSYSGIGTNTLTVEFNLQNNYERIISISAMSTEILGNYSYGDNVPDDFDEELGMNLNPNAGDTYNVNAGKSVTLSGILDEGDAEDYEWLWTFDESSITLTGHNPSHVFNIPDIYTGIAFVYDGQGNWGAAFFEVNVSAASAGNGGGTNEEPGFELILVIAAIAVALILLRKKKK